MFFLFLLFFVYFRYKFEKEIPPTLLERKLKKRKLNPNSEQEEKKNMNQKESLLKPKLHKLNHLRPVI